MKKIKRRKTPTELAILCPMKKSYRKIYHKMLQKLRIQKKLKQRIDLYEKIKLAVAFLSFYYIKKGYIYFYQKKILKKNIKEPRYKKIKAKINKISYTRDELFNILEALI